MTVSIFRKRRRNKTINISTTMWALLRFLIIASINLLVSSEEIFKVENDYFFGYGPHFEQKMKTEDSGHQFTRSSSLKKLEILVNDRILNEEVGSCTIANGEDFFVGNDEEKKKLIFEEVAKKVGFKHLHKDRQPHKNDCLFDTTITGPNNYTARLKGEGCTYEKLTGGVAVGDYDGDGWDDVFFTVFYGNSLLYRNNGDGTFTDVTRTTNVGPSMYGSSAGWIDIDSDGDLDLYVTTVGDSRHYLYVNHGGYFTEEAKERGLSLEFESKRLLSGMTPNFGDYDRDGFLDVYTAEWIMNNANEREFTHSATRLFRNKGTSKPGYFEDTTDFAGVSMDNAWKFMRTSHIAGTHTFSATFTDFDNDNWSDLFVTGDFGQSKMFWNNKNGTFTECTKECGIIGNQDAMGLAVGDFDRDGKQDFFISAVHYSNKSCPVFSCFFGEIGNALYLGNSNRKFKMADKYGAKKTRWAWGAAMFDFNNDGRLDIAVTNGFQIDSTTLEDSDFDGKESINLFQNQGRDTPMVDVTKETGLEFDGMGRAMAILDFDRDGHEDLLVVDNTGPPLLWRNKGGSDKNKWIKIKVMHKCDNNPKKYCDSYGAKVYVTTKDNETQFTEVGSKTHYMGQSTITCHFGVGKFDYVDITIFWPRFDKTITLQSVKTKQIMRITPDLANQEAIIDPSFQRCDPLRINTITKQPNAGTIQMNPDGKSVSYKLNHGQTIMDVGVQYFQYNVKYKGQLLIGNVTIDLRGKPPLFIPNKCFRPGSNKPNGNTARSADLKIRPLDGRFNNPKESEWGASRTFLKRLSSHAYADNISEPSGGCTRHHALTGTCPYPKENSGMGSTRPSPRLISNELFRQIEDIPSKRKLSDMSVHFGQFVSHDTDHSVTFPRFSFLQYHLNQVFLPITVPKGDVQFDPYNTGKETITFARSMFNGCTGSYVLGRSPRQQTNIVTSFIDGNHIYGSDKERSDHLREFKGGRMRTGKGDLLPKNEGVVANENPVNRPTKELFVSGDLRSNVQPVLTSLHVVFLREHNRLAKEYIHRNPMALDEEIFQYARKHVIGQLQYITYNEYLPSILGSKHTLPKYTGYNKNVDATVSTEFATAAFRFGHSQVNSKIFRLQPNGKPIKEGHLLLREAYFKPNRIENEGGVDPLLRGSVYTRAQEVDLKMVDEMRDNLFPQDGASPGKQTGFDLAAINIQRGRDHGIADLNSVRKALGLKVYKSFDEITSDKTTSEKLQKVYKDINTIDLWVGGLAEHHVEDAEVGETFHQILVDQFTRLRDGDRFWYQHQFNKKEIKEIEKSSLSEIIRRNTMFDDCPSNLFFTSGETKDEKDVNRLDNESENTANDETDEKTYWKLFVIGAIVLSVIILILVAILGYMLTKKSKTISQDQGSEMAFETNVNAHHEKNIEA
ncbi:uncharacterized protein [Clytia hemisphaerica]